WVVLIAVRIGLDVLGGHLGAHLLTSTGTIKVRATGMVGNAVRSVVASIRQQGFIDFLYFTDLEIQDPQISGDDATMCTKYAYQGRPTSGCDEIAFGGGDVIDLMAALRASVDKKRSGGTGSRSCACRSSGRPSCGSGRASGSRPACSRSGCWPSSRCA
ncbi:hypothetical protein IAE22_30930, partial [Bacillus sp. S34]|nr:hypothetical protein [Bacillus sp. S34]